MLEPQVWPGGANSRSRLEERGEIRRRRSERHRKDGT